MKRTEEVELTNMAMIYNKDRVLVQNRKKSWKGLAFPGGHVENHESIVDSMIREIKEETGLDIDHLKMCGVKQWFNSEGVRNIVFLFKTDCCKGTLISNDEGINEWMTFDELLNRKEEFANNFDVMLEVFRNDDINEHYRIHQGDDVFDLLK